MSTHLISDNATIKKVDWWRKELGEAMNNSLTNVNTEDFLLDLKKTKRMTVAQKMQLAHLQIEAQRLEIEKVKSRTAQRFWSKNFVAIISLAAVLISFAQVWSNNIQKDKELAIKDKELEISRTKTQQDFDALNTQLTEQQKAGAVKFISDFKEVFIRGDKAKLDAFESFIRVNFPIVSTEGFFSAFEISTTPTENGREIQTIRTFIIPKVKQPKSKEVLPIRAEQKNILDYPNVIRGENGTFKPAEGYEWINREDSKDLRVKLKTGIN